MRRSRVAVALFTMPARHRIRRILGRRRPPRPNSFHTDGVSVASTSVVKARSIPQSTPTTGRIAVHQHGPLWRWLRASVAIPGVLPPVFQGGEVFVDGGAMNNLPVDVMRAKGRGPVVGVDCGMDRAFTTDVDATETPSLWKLFATRAGRGRPNILRILWRAGMVNSAAATLERRLQSDLLITPALESLDLLDWKGFARAIEIGYRDACERLADGALAQLRQVYAPGTLS